MKLVRTMDRAEERAGLEDVGEQALMRGLATAFPFVRLGLSRSGIGRRSDDRPHSSVGNSPCRGPTLTAARLMSKVSDHIKPPVVGAVSCVVQRPASKPVSLFDLGARFFVPTRAAAGTPRAAAVKAGRRGASAALSAVARLRAVGTISRPAPGVRTARLIAQMKADSSRAIAVATMLGSLPLRISDRKRPHNRVWAFQAISRTRLGAAATFACFSRPTRGGCR